MGGSCPDFYYIIPYYYWSCLFTFCGTYFVNVGCSLSIYCLFLFFRVCRFFFGVFARVLLWSFWTKMAMFTKGGVQGISGLTGAHTLTWVVHPMCCMVLNILTHYPLHWCDATGSIFGKKKWLTRAPNKQSGPRQWWCVLGDRDPNKAGKSVFAETEATRFHQSRRGNWSWDAGSLCNFPW